VVCGGVEGEFGEEGCNCRAVLLVGEVGEGMGGESHMYIRLCSRGCRR